MKVIIDRFEGEYAVCEMENGQYVNIEIKKLPEGAKEGDVLQLGNKITIDKEETEKRKAEIERLANELWD